MLKLFIGNSAKILFPQCNETWYGYSPFIASQFLAVFLFRLEFSFKCSFQFFPLYRAWNFGWLNFLGVSWCCGNYCQFAFVLWCGYCSVSFQSFVLRHWCPQHQETTNFLKSDKCSRQDVVGKQQNWQWIFPQNDTFFVRIGQNIQVLSIDGTRDLSLLTLFVIPIY